MSGTGSARVTEGARLHDTALRKRLLIRVGIAAVIVLALVLALSLIEPGGDRSEKPTTPIVREEMAPIAIDRTADIAAAGLPGTVPSPDEASLPTTEAEVGQATSSVEVEAEPELTEGPKTELPKNGAAGIIDPVERPLTVPGKMISAAVRPDEPASVASVTNAASIAEPDQVPSTSVERKSPPAVSSTPPAVAGALSAARHFLVQAGVFNNADNAEELRAKIAAAGIPVRIESRVQVGPFADRKEAEDARRKLQALGVDSGLIVAVRK